MAILQNTNFSMSHPSLSKILFSFSDIPSLMIFIFSHNFPLSLNLLYDLIARFIKDLSCDSSTKRRYKQSPT